MDFLVDLDMALFCTRYKLERELLAWHLLREESKGRSGYINRKAAIALLQEKTGCSYPTACRRVNSLLEISFATKAGKGNIHITGLHRIKAVLEEKFGEDKSFVKRRRCFEATFNEEQLKDLNAFKAQVFSALTADKLARNEQKAVKEIREKSSKPKLGKAAISMALAEKRYLGSYSIGLQSVDFNIAAGTASKRSRLAQKLGYQQNIVRAMPGYFFTDRKLAIFAGFELGLSGFGRPRLLSLPNGVWAFRDADKIVPGIALLRRGKAGHAHSKGACTTVSGQQTTLSYEKDRTLIFNKLANRQIFFEPQSDKMGYDYSSFSLIE